MIVAENESKVDEAVMRLARVGIENVKGYLAGGMDAWRHAGLDVSTIEQISVDDLSELLSSRKDMQVIDVRQPGEYNNEHVPSAVNAPLARVGERATGVRSESPDGGHLRGWLSFERGDERPRSAGL